VIVRVLVRTIGFCWCGAGALVRAAISCAVRACKPIENAVTVETTAPTTPPAIANADLLVIERSWGCLLPGTVVTSPSAAGQGSVNGLPKVDGKTL
jgi:hypothetical protein